MVHQSPVFYCTTAKDLDALVAFFEEHEGNFLLFGDMSIFYCLTGRPSVMPALWYHDGLTTPKPGSPEFLHFQDTLGENLDRCGVRYIVLECNGTWNGSRLTDYRSIVDYMGNKPRQPVWIGPFKIIDVGSSMLGPPP